MIQPPTQHAPSEETPETDAMERVLLADDSSTPAQTFEMCMDFARSLERRLRAALAKRDDETQKAVDESCKQVIHHWRERVLKMEAELSEARKDTERLDLALKRERAELDDELVHDVLGRVSYESIRARILAIDRAREGKA